MNQKINKKVRTDANPTWFMQGWAAMYFVFPEEAFKDIRAYVSDSDQFVKGEQERFLKRSEAVVSNLSEEEREWYYDANSDEHERLTAGLPQLVRSSNLLVACSLFESSLTDLCKYVDRESQIVKKFSWVKIDGQGIVRAASYLRKNFEIECAHYAGWSTILDHFEIRHCFAHANGDISLMKSHSRIRIQQLLRKEPFSVNHIDGARRLRLGRRYVDVAVDQMEGFWPALHDAFFYDDVIGRALWPMRP